jgi:hypothetical protein
VKSLPRSLPADTGLIQVLPKIPLLIQETDANQRDAKIARGFEVIARQHSQSTGKSGQRLR